MNTQKGYPLILIILCLVLFFFGLGSRDFWAPVELRQRSMLRTLLTVFAVAVIVNYLWELAQAPLYAGLESYDTRVFWHCLAASLGDGIMVLLIVAAGWITLKRLDWFERPGIAGYVVMLIAGFLLAVLVEWAAVHIAGRWAYAEQMPIVPGLNVGLVPVAQMLFLPPLIFRIVVILGGKR